MTALLGTFPLICTAPLSGRLSIDTPAGSQLTRLPDPLIADSAIAALPPAFTHGQSVVIVFVLYLLMAAFSQACSSSGGFAATAFCTILSWHLMIAPASLPRFPPAFCSHLDAALSRV